MINKMIDDFSNINNYCNKKYIKMGFIGGIRIFNIAILDDEHDCLDMLSKEINVILFSRKNEYKIKTFFKSDDFLDYAKLNSINLLFLDIDMSGCNGITFSKNIYKTMPVLYL